MDWRALVKDWFPQFAKLREQYLILHFFLLNFRFFWKKLWSKKTNFLAYLGFYEIFNFFLLLHFLDFSDIFSSILGFFFKFFFNFRISRFIITTKWPKIDWAKHHRKLFFCPKSKKRPPQELEVCPHSRPYLQVNF